MSSLNLIKLFVITERESKTNSKHVMFTDACASFTELSSADVKFSEKKYDSEETGKFGLKLKSDQVFF